MRRVEALGALVGACGMMTTVARAQAPAPGPQTTPFPIPFAGRVASAPARATIPFVVTDPLPLLAARLNDHDALLLIDTGGADLTIDPAFAGEIGVALTDAGSGVFAGGKRATIKRGIVPRVALGDIELADIPTLGLPTRQLPFFGERRADGVIGTRFLARFLPTIDYVRGALVLRTPEGTAPFGDAMVRDGAMGVPMSWVPDHFLFVSGRINDGPEGFMLVDTGLAGGGISPSRTAVADSHIALDEASAITGMGGGGAVRAVPFHADVTVGTRRVRAVEGLYTPGGDPFGIFPFPIRGAVSHGYFRDCALTFDFDRARLIVSR
jgi:hypothetical protein